MYLKSFNIVAARGVGPMLLDVAVRAMQCREVHSVDIAILCSSNQHCVALRSGPGVIRIAALRHVTIYAQERLNKTGQQSEQNSF